MAIQKSTGKTPTEKLLAGLCEQSFLKLWSYPNPHRDDGKELCDLLVVFEQQVFIFVDRESRHFQRSSNETLLSWQRWKDQAIDAQIRSVNGVERYLKAGRSVFLDPARTVRFPISIDTSSARFYKIVVAHGAKEACKAFSPGNVFGSLAISYADQEVGSSFPFIIHLDRRNPVHVFDSHNLPIVLGELDTIYDFSTYLDAKQSAIQKYRHLSYCGEEDLLAHYLYNLDENTKRNFIGAKEGNYDSIMIGEGEWKDFVQLPQYGNKKELDKVSQLWDDIIQRTCQHALDGTYAGTSNVLKGRSAIHEMAKEPRFVRRALSQRILQAIRDFPESSTPRMRKLSYMESFHPGKAYVFLQLKVDNKGDYEREYRPIKQAMLEIACAAAKLRFPQLHTVIGIAIEAPKFSGGRNAEDFILMDCSSWTNEIRRHYEEANEHMKFFRSTNQTVGTTRTYEFPLDDSGNANGSGL
jgi:hypothetical protein